MTVEAFITPILRAGVYDRVNVYTENMVPAFPYATAMKLEVKEEAKFPEHPIETGATFGDHIVFLPNEITLYLFLNSATYQITYPQIQQIWQNATSLIVQTWAGIYTNMFIQNIPHGEDPKVFNSITMEMKLRQIMTVSAQYEPAPANPENKSTKDKGTVNGTTVPELQSSPLRDGAKSILNY